MKRKLPYKDWLYSVATWVILFYLFYLLAFFSSSDLIKQNFFYDYLNSWKAHLEIILTGVSFGFLFGLINTISENTKLRRRPFGQIILIKTAMYLLSFLIVSLILTAVFIGFKIMEWESIKELWKYYSYKPLLSLLIYLFFLIIMVNIATQINKKFGPGNFLKLLIGKYNIPQDESKIFMFLDLRGSTSIAEQLGHKKYSQFLRNCYHDLTEFVIKYDAEIYQYVGDEVVLCWDTRSGIRDLNCIKLFYAYSKKLAENHKYYQSQFGFTPVFKCGIDTGTVTATEIGDLKREIAYHGDVLNTASRIQELCNKFDKTILISEHLLLGISQDLKTELITDITLRGKKEKLKIYSPEITN